MRPLLAAGGPHSQAGCPDRPEARTHTDVLSEGAPSLAADQGTVDVDLDLTLAASFLVLAEERHYGRAAARLNLTASALTKRIQRLERQLGVALLDRGPGGVVDLTAAGSRFAVLAGPLLAHATAARSATRNGLPGQDVRLGIPAGSGAALRHLDLAAVARKVRLSYPETRLVCVDVDFPQMRHCLPDGQVDVLWTDAPVRHREVTSDPLAVMSRRIGVVGARHELAGAGTVDVRDFAAQEMLFNPAVPEEWMTPFWLGDLRVRRDAQLIAVDAQDHAAVLSLTRTTGMVTVVLEVSAPLLGPHLRAVALRGAPPVVFHAAHRRTERRGPVLALVRTLQAMGPRRLGAATVSDREPVVVPGGPGV